MNINLRVNLQRQPHFEDTYKVKTLMYEYMHRDITKRALKISIGLEKFKIHH
jgi:hypothetical protein